MKPKGWLLTDNVVKFSWQRTTVHPVLITEAAAQLRAGGRSLCWHQVLKYLACVDVRCRPEQSQLIKVWLVWVIQVKVCSMRQYHLYCIADNQHQQVYKVHNTIQ